MDKWPRIKKEAELSNKYKKKTDLLTQQYNFTHEFKLFVTACTNSCASSSQTKSWQWGTREGEHEILPPAEKLMEFDS